MRKALKLSLLLGIIALMLVVTACGVSGDYKDNKPPTISITSYEGVVPTSDEAENSELLSFQQKIFWNAQDVDGFVTGYAYRILDKEGNPISGTPENEAISSASVVEGNPNMVVFDKGGIKINGEMTYGWIIHHPEGSDVNQDLTLPGSDKTVWVDNQYAVINFPANVNNGEIADEDGDGWPEGLVSAFQIVCIDNRGAVSSKIATKNYKVYSSKSHVSISTSKGDPTKTAEITIPDGTTDPETGEIKDLIYKVKRFGLGKTVGTGLSLNINMFKAKETDTASKEQRANFNVNNFGVEGYDHFEIRVQRYVIDRIEEVPSGFYGGTVDSVFATPIDEGSTDWKVIPDNYNPKNIIVTKRSSLIQLTPDFDGDNQTHFTQILVRGYNLAGVVSDENYIEFACKDGYFPQTLIYDQKKYALGANHYIDYPNASELENYPYDDSGEIFKTATRLLPNAEGIPSVVWSEDLTVYCNWGYHGQYGKREDSGVVIVSDNPYDDKVNILKSEVGDINYYSEVVGYDLRFDDAPYDYYAFNGNREERPVFDHDTLEPTGESKTWTFVPMSSKWPISSKGMIMHNIAPGMHKLEVSAVDLQNEYDRTPMTFEFEVVAPTPKAEKSGVLVIDATSYPNSANLLKDKTNEVMEYAFSDVSEVTFVNRAHKAEQYSLNINNCLFSFADLDKYKYVVYHEQDGNGSDKGFVNDQDALKLYLSNGGNLVIMSRASLFASVEFAYNNNRNTFEKYFGIKTKDMVPVVSLTTTTTLGNVVVGATSQSEVYPNLTIDDFEEIKTYDRIVHYYKGINCDIIKEEALMPGTEVLYRAVAKNVEDVQSAAYPDVFENISNKACGITYKTENNECSIISFPLVYFGQESAKQIIEQLIK